MRYQDVFVPGGFPRYTYNPRVELQLEQRLSEARDNLCKLVTVTGQTKSGKTVLTKKVFPREEAVWVDGGIVSAEEDFGKPSLNNWISSSQQNNRNPRIRTGRSVGEGAWKQISLWRKGLGNSIQR